MILASLFTMFEITAQREKDFKYFNYPEIIVSLHRYRGFEKSYGR